MRLRVGITGGIGSGKSTVSSVIASLGFPTYNADLEARKLMDSDVEIIGKIKRLFGNDIYSAGLLNRRKVAEQVFSHKGMLEELNGIVHPYVFSHFTGWVERNKSADIVFLESANLFESGAGRYIDKVIGVISDIELRVRRVMARDNFSRSEILRRVGNQLADEDLVAKCDFIIENNENSLILPQILNILERVKIIKVTLHG